MQRVLDVFWTFLRLGCTSFGGPVAHLAYFRREFVERRAWIDDGTFAQCVALTQLLPGPGSSQTGMLIGWLRAGPGGAFAAWLAFTLPSAVIMTLFARTTPAGGGGGGGWLHGLLIVAAAVVASALVALRATLAPDAPRLSIALAVMAATIVLPSPATSPAAIGIAAAVGLAALRPPATSAPTLDLRVSRAAGAVVLGAFVAALMGLGWWASPGSHVALLTDTLFRVGSLVFGGGHVVLPLLQTQAVSAGIVDQRTVLAGYAAAQAIPGPLFTIATYVGACAWRSSLGVPGALLGTIAIFAPSFFLLAGVAPFYRALASNARFRAALAGANAGVVGLLAAALVTPILHTAVHTALDALGALAAFAALRYANIPVWAIVMVAALLGFLLER